MITFFGGKPTTRQGPMTQGEGRNEGMHGMHQSFKNRALEGGMLFFFCPLGTQFPPHRRPFKHPQHPFSIHFKSTLYLVPLLLRASVLSKHTDPPRRNCSLSRGENMQLGGSEPVLQKAAKKKNLAFSDKIPS